MKHSKEKCEMKALVSCVDEFCESMKEKLIAKWEDGYSGWDDPTWTVDRIHEQLINHIHKPNNDMVDIANFAMFIWNRQGD